MNLSEAGSAYRLTAAVLAAGIFWTTLRHLAGWRLYASGGLYAWRLFDERPVRTSGRLAAWLLEQPGLTIILALRGTAAAATCLLAVSGILSAISVTLLLVTTLIKQWRLRLINEEAEIMNVTVLFPLFFRAWRPDDAVIAAAGLWFIALQVALAYLGAGLSKLRSQRWRHGVALAPVLDSSLVRNPRLARALAQRPWLGFTLCWGTIVFELLFPLAPVVPQGVLPVMLVAGVLFHLSIAVVLGLGSFLWAFVATYPAVMWVNSAVTPMLWR